MRAFFGALIILLGVFLMIWSLGAYDSLQTQVSNLTSGARVDRSQWMLIGGVLALLVGMAMGFSRRHSHHLH
jgi:hypothetical protein